MLPVAAAAVAVACAPASTPHEIVPLSDAPAAEATILALEVPGEFHVSRVWRDVEALLSEAARAPGSDGAERAREYLAEELEQAGLRIEEIVHTVSPLRGADVEPHAPAPLTSLLAISEQDAKGAAELLLFVAPYTTTSVPGYSASVGEGGSGAAVLLELARALASRPVAPEGYAHAFLFVSGDGDPGDPTAGSRSVSELLGQRDILDRVRAGVFIDRVCDPDLRLVRDLYSSRNYREIIWRAARELGHTGVFAGAGLDSPNAGHRAFLAAGVGQMAALVGSGGTAADSLASCSLESLAAVGAVVMEASGIVETRLAQIDRFAAAPAAVTASDERERRAASWREPAPEGGPGVAPDEIADEADVAAEAAMSDNSAEADTAPAESSEGSSDKDVAGEE